MRDIVTGQKGGIVPTTYQYDPSNQTYTLMTQLEAATRFSAVAFVLGDETSGFHAFVATGWQGGFTPFDDMLEFKPDEAMVVGD